MEAFTNLLLESLERLLEWLTTTGVRVAFGSGLDPASASARSYCLTSTWLRINANSRAMS
jgi:hypothetical protein